MEIMDWENLLNDTPDDWLMRAAYADWLEENRIYEGLCATQRWMVKNKKCPGPACVLEAKWYEASWFSASQEGVRWTMQDRKRYRIKPEWCLVVPFYKLRGFEFANRRDKTCTELAKSWLSRRAAERALFFALFPFYARLAAETDELKHDFPE